MKKFIKILKFAVTTLAIIVSFAYLTWDVCNDQFVWEYFQGEKVCYIIWGVGFIVCFYAIADNFKHLWSKITAGVLTSLLYTILVFFANTIWKYICINMDFNWRFDIPYSEVMKSDIMFTYDYGWLRYPAAFVFVMLPCVLKILMSLPKIKAVSDKVIDKFYNWLYIEDLKTQSLDELYYDFIEEESLKKLIDYIRNMPLTENGKKELADFIDLNNDETLILLFVMHYEELLTVDEYVKYRQQYVEISKEKIEMKRNHYNSKEVEFSDAFKRLDSKFGLAH